MAKITTYVTPYMTFADGGSIKDDAGNEVVKYSKTASAVNEITFKNNATGSAPEAQATGDDTDIDFPLVPKGKGKSKTPQNISLFTLSNLTTNGDYCGDVTAESVNEDGSLYDVLYLHSTGYKKAKADADATLPCVALRLETGTGVKNLLLRGFVKNTSWTFTVGNLIWVSAAAAGIITATKPTTTGNRVQCVGYAVATDIIYFNPNYVWVEVG